jgi:EAL domain-containing protein (putative c-di-GMP-specific phosphodiesterase class I)
MSLTIEPTQGNLKHFKLEADLYRAVDQDEFELYYQPIIELRTGRMTGMEALIRWNHPTLGMISPADFIPLANDTGLIIPIGNWVLETACVQASKWHREFEREDDLSITVNISGRQFQSATLIDSVATALVDAGLDAHNLILEITETTMLQNSVNTLAKLEALKEIGVRLAIDDFGTGYSSLSYLIRFPLDILKIDKSVIDKVCEGREAASIARGMITMGNTLRLNTVAEGIESAEQAYALRDLGCEMAQGYHFAKPMSATQMEQFLHRASNSIEPGSDTSRAIQLTTVDTAIFSPIS